MCQMTLLHAYSQFAACMTIKTLDRCSPPFASCGSAGMLVSCKCHLALLCRNGSSSRGSTDGHDIPAVSSRGSAGGPGHVRGNRQLQRLQRHQVSPPAAPLLLQHLPVCRLLCPGCNAVEHETNLDILEGVGLTHSDVQVETGSATGAASCRHL